MTSEAYALWTIVIILTLVNVITPIVSVGMSQSYIEHDSNSYESVTSPSLSDYFAIGGLSILTIPFWTFGFPVYINLLIMMPIRILGWILILRLIRGN